MAKFTIAEYENLADDGRDRVIPAVREPPLATQALDFTGGIQTSAAFQERTRFVRLHTDTACFILFGANPVALSGTSPGMAAGQTETMGVQKGIKVSVIS